MTTGTTVLALVPLALSSGRLGNSIALGSVCHRWPHRVAPSSPSCSFRRCTCGRTECWRGGGRGRRKGKGRAAAGAPTGAAGTIERRARDGNSGNGPGGRGDDPSFVAAPCRGTGPWRCRCRRGGPAGRTGGDVDPGGGRRQGDDGQPADAGARRRSWSSPVPVCGRRRRPTVLGWTCGPIGMGKSGAATSRDATSGMQVGAAPPKCCLRVRCSAAVPRLGESPPGGGSRGAGMAP